MSSKTIIIGVILALLVVGVGVFYFITSEDTETGTTANKSRANITESQDTESTDDSSQQVEIESVSLSDPLSEIGATGNEGPVNGNTYTFEGVEYRFEEPSNWETSMSQRSQACEQGYVNTSYQVATDGSTWFVTTDFNEDYAALVNALKEVGIDAKIDSYC